MRKLSLAFSAINLIAFIFSNSSVQAQYFPASNGNHGIGTSTPNTFLEIKKVVPGGMGPVLRLTGGGEVNGQCGFEMTSYDAGSNPAAFRILATDLGNHIDRVDFQTKPAGLASALETRLTIWGENIGIGTTTPGTRLHVEGNGYYNGHLVLGPEDHTIGVYGKRIDFGMNSNSDPQWISRYNASADGSELRVNISDEGGNTDRFVVGWTNFSSNQWMPIMEVNANGAVGIGTNKTSEAGYKLFVETGIRTRKVKVDALTWADYVFHANYRLRPLSEVEQYIKANGHLPEVPSEEEVKKEGIDLGNNQATLLKKIEELTLYVIEQNKRQENQEKLIQEQRLQLKNQQERLVELEKQLREKVTQ